MSIVDYASGTRACSACAVACDECAGACRQSDPQALGPCMELSRDCADICRLAVLLMTRNSDRAAVLCRLCAQICEACAEECGRQRLAECQECAQTCQHCAEECELLGEAA